MVVFRLEAGINCASKENLIDIKISSMPICEISRRRNRRWTPTRARTPEPVPIAWKLN